MSENGTNTPESATGGESKNKAKNDAKRAAKLEKFKAKQEKVNFSKDNSTASAALKPKKFESSKVEVVQTPVGEKKDMSVPMASAYDPIAVESSWYSWWEKSGLFKPESNGTRGGEPYTVVMPPPNVTGSLHLGHATMLAIEDAIIRWHRMNGKAVLYLPGCDHAGIATQAVIEKRLKKERNLTRHDLGREAFVQEIWKWKEEYGHRIYDQIRRMGASADWDRACFTLDKNVSEAVAEAFIKLFNEGLIFRENRLVNWCGKLKTSLSDLEVDTKEIEGEVMLSAHGHDPKKKYRFGVMTDIAYKIDGGAEGEEIIISTTRPETLFADVALCVNANDKRYFKYHGKNVIHPILGTSIPIICDDAADPEFGTGALKISPAHDHTDFAVGQRHKLKPVVIFDENNVLNHNCGTFAGMARYEARDAVVEYLKQTGAYRGEKSHSMSLPVCSRSGDFVEPRLIPQWWLNCKDMAAKAVQAVRDGELEITPREHEKIWFYWLENIRDWCLSRQLWWGHRIPAYRIHIAGDSTTDEELWIAARSEEEALKLAQDKCPTIDPKDILISQDEDVLDTWFSSALWPFSTLGWPKMTPDLERFFPTSLLETGSDILFFWVARMVMMGMHLTGKIPFSKIFLHAIVRDAHGRKMSKSLGNVIDPIDVIEGISLETLQKRLDDGNLDPNEVKIAKDGQRRDFPNGIPQCGTDALRFGLCSYIAEGRDINMNINRIEGYRRFCNKLWNATRFALMKLGADYQPEKSLSLIGQESIVDKWILCKLNHAIKETNKAMGHYNLMQATQAIYSFWLYDLCDVYIEAIKPVLIADHSTMASRCAANVLYICLEQGLRLLHPFMPFVTEELYQRLPRRPEDTIPSISVSPYPQANALLEHPEAEALFDRLNNIVRAVRKIASEQKLAKTTTITLGTSDQSCLQSLLEQEPSISSLVRSFGILKISDQAPAQSLPIDEGAFVHFQAQSN